MCGKVRTETIKKYANKIYEKFPDKFNFEFENNKNILKEFTIYNSKHFRNRIAGYITRILKTKMMQEKLDNQDTS